MQCRVPACAGGTKARVVRAHKDLISRLPSESAEAALRRIERQPGGWLLLETDAGQSLMAEAHRMAAESRRHTARMSRREADRA